MLIVYTLSPYTGEVCPLRTSSTLSSMELLCLHVPSGIHHPGLDISPSGTSVTHLQISLQSRKKNRCLKRAIHLTYIRCLSVDEMNRSLEKLFL